MKAGKRTLWANMALVGATMIWGFAFVVMKNAVEILPTNLLLAIRFSSGFLLLGVIFFKKWKLFDLGTLWRGAVMGVLLYLAYYLQTTGLADTTPGKNAFLTAAYCILVPFVFWITNRKSPRLQHVAAALLCITGIGFVSLDGASVSLTRGDAYTLTCAVMFALHIVSVSNFSRQKDVILLTIVQFGVCAALCWGVGLTWERFPARWLAQSWKELLFLCVFATSLALLLQNIGQKYTSPSAASILLSLEAVFGVLSSMLFYGEQLSLRLVVGFVLIFLAILISQIQFRSARRHPALRGDERTAAP